MTIVLDFVPFTFRVVTFEISTAVEAVLAVVNITYVTWLTAELEWVDLQDCTSGVDKIMPHNAN